MLYETADPGKFADDVERAISVVPDAPDRIAKQTRIEERIYRIDDPPEITTGGALALSEAQYEKAKTLIAEIFNARGS